jgi:hypothetical protein
MSDSILSSNAGIFPCPNCGQMIYSDSDKCRFCSAPVDRQAATLGAEVQAKVNGACNQAKLLRNTAGAMWLFFLLGLIPFLPFGWGFTGLFVVIPVWLIYWQVKFGRIQTQDADYKRAKRDWSIALIIWLPALVIQIFSIVVRLMFRAT